MMGRLKNKPRRFKGFAVIERPAGSLVWGTFRPTEGEARATFEKWNPSVEDAAVVRVEISIFES
jgi:hypothetical protein